MKKFSELPERVQGQCREMLKAYDSVNVSFENGSIQASTGTCIRSKYPADREVWGRYRAKDVFTESEQIINYVECFHSYPLKYKGRKDWGLIAALKEARKARQEISLIMIGGDLARKPAASDLEAEAAAIDAIDALNHDMYESPDSYFSPDDKRREY